jgi:putative heme-binding domain-containing protein
LEKLAPGTDPDEQVALVKSLRRLHSDDVEFAARERVVKLLERNNKKSFPFETGKGGYRLQPEAINSWTNWVTSQFPEQAASELGGNDQELSKLNSLLSEVDWAAGDSVRGAALFAARSCRQCHNGRTALGPDLGGVAARFSREDLFTAVVAPSRDVSARYQTTNVLTKDGKTYSGIIVYESVDGFILRNGTSQAFRIEANQVEERRKSPISLMPSGLLKDFTAKDYADFYAYLKSISNAQNANAAAAATSAK